MKKNILYIHGFNSSPLSTKAEQTRLFFANNYPDVGFFCPQLATTPRKAIEQLKAIIENNSQVNEGELGQPKTIWYLVGSSLGGYFSSYLSEKYNCLAVLVNPAIKPFELLHDYLGEQVNPYTEEVYQVTQDHIQQLKALETESPLFDDDRKNNYLVMVQKGDEVLNYQEAVEKYKHCRLIVQEGGDHSFINFDQSLPAMSDFFKCD